MADYPSEQDWWPSFEAQCQALYVQAGQSVNWSAFRWAARTAYDIAAGMAPDASAAKHLTELRVALNLAGPVVKKPVQPLPPKPTRDQVCGVTLKFQGRTLLTQQYGALPWFEAALTSLNADDRQALYASKHAGPVPDTHCYVVLTWNYNEPDQPYGTDNLVPGRDMSGDLPSYKALVREVIDNGFTPICVLGGDGEGAGPGYNTAVGWTYGHAWLMAQLPAIVAALDELCDYCLFCPGFDGVFYGWTVEELDAFGKLFRSLLPDGHLMLEFSEGVSHLGNGATDYMAGHPLANFDVIASEYDVNLHQDSDWQINARLEPNYIRPSDEPATDDPTPPHYLASGTPRGPYFHVALEYGLYQDVRGQISDADIQKDRDYQKGQGVKWTG